MEGQLTLPNKVARRKHCYLEIEKRIAIDFCMSGVMKYSVSGAIAIPSEAGCAPALPNSIKFPKNSQTMKIRQFFPVFFPIALIFCRTVIQLEKQWTTCFSRKQNYAGIASKINRPAGGGYPNEYQKSTLQNFWGQGSGYIRMRNGCRRGGFTGGMENGFLGRCCTYALAFGLAIVASDYAYRRYFGVCLICCFTCIAV